MEMMNRAVEDASDFMEMKRKLMAEQQHQLEQRILAAEKRGAKEMLEDTGKLEIAPQADPDPLAKLPGENRAQYRARIHGKKAVQP